MTPYEQFKSECNKEITLQDSPELWQKTYDWMFANGLKHYSYHFEWMGRPIIQYPQDIVQFQEIVWQTKPDLIIETGIAHGGSLMLSASMLALLDMTLPLCSSNQVDGKQRMVLGIDIDIRKHNREAIETHPMANRIKMIEGSSIDFNVAARVKDYAKKFNSIMVCLDSNHTHEHVLEELRIYAELVSIGNYCIVWDTVIEDMPCGSFPERPWDKGRNPKTAVWEFIKGNDDFIIDKDIQNKLLITVAPDGYLKRMKK
jgi:cephalosporin hydroxylase